MADSAGMGISHPSAKLLSLSSPLITWIFQLLEDERTSQQLEMKAETSKNQTVKYLYETVAKLIKSAEVPSLVAEVKALFEASNRQSECILNLPMEDTCWCIGDWEYSQHQDERTMRFVGILDLTTSQQVTQMTSLIYKSDMSYKDQAMQLLYYACLNPVKKCPRRPHYVKLLNTPEARNVTLDLTSLGVNFLDSNMEMDGDLNKPAEESSVWFRRCFSCGIRGTPDMFTPCSECSAVMYCDRECQVNSWKQRHKKWCKKFKQFMKMEHQLAEFPFTFSKTSTSLNFTREKLKCFLEENDVYNKGLWRRECPSYRGTKADIPFDLWRAGNYYNYRGFWLDSPIAGLLHYPLTLYWIIVSWLPEHYVDVFKKMKTSGCLQVHIIGAEREAEMFDPFLECARLLAPIHLHLHLFGNELSKHIHNNCQTKENLTFQVHCSLYHEYQLLELPAPDLAVGFNAGLSAYSTFIQTVKLLLEERTAFFCTDYCYYSVVHSQRALSNSHIGRMLHPVINPFRSPFRLPAEEVNFPRYSNAFIFCLKPYDDNVKEPNTWEGIVSNIV
ncbi:unnamed protein product [Candidula unifasciata]|uniref:MYND-type domain-containing protein n=1 Tax=Candidula unifasciata TaxID=100452 RepID=A0A8S3Z9L7_9EUPU|nr:unnamed protein product [Candidula unifasciata]